MELVATLASAARLGISETERAALVVYLACNPNAGAIVSGTGGVRKLRWALRGRGKSGGARVIYYYHNESIPLYALDVYAKNQKGNLSATEKKAAPCQSNPSPEPRGECRRAQPLAAPF